MPLGHQKLIFVLLFFVFSTLFLITVFNNFFIHLQFLAPYKKEDVYTN